MLRKGRHSVMAKLSSAEVTSRLKSGKYRLRSVSAGKSDVWNSFGLVVDEEGDELDFAACKLCHQALTYAGT